MNTSFKYYTIFFMLIVISSCEKTITNYKPITPNLQVLSSLQCIDSVATCYLTKTNDLNDIVIHPIDNSTIYLYDSNNFIIDTLKYYTNGLYRGKVKLNQPLINYSIRSIAPNYPEANCTFQFPINTDYTITNTIYNEIPTNYSSSTYNGSRVFININDPSDINYYSLNVYLLDSVLSGSNYKKTYTEMVFTSDDPSIKKDMIYDNSGGFAEGFLFSDGLFNGTNHSIELNIASAHRPDNSFTFVIVLKTLSEEYYKFYKGYNKQYEAQINSTIGLNYLYNLYPYDAIYSNINGGLGIFAGYNYTAKTVTITK